MAGTHYSYMKATTHLMLIKLEFSRQFSKNTEITSFMKIRPEGPELLHVDGRKDE